METKEQIKNRLKGKYGVELTPNSDFIKLPDEILANAHLYDWGDKVSVQANVEMSRRLKETTISLAKENGKMQRKILWLTFVGIIIATTQIVPIVDIILKWLN